MPDICRWTGSSNRVYEYEIYPVDSNWNPVAANYIFARRSPYAADRWIAIYIGQTSDIKDRFANHHRATCISRQGATHVHIHMNANVETAQRTRSPT